jgi:hypothetical protein
LSLELMLMRNAVFDAMLESEVASRSGKWVVKVVNEEEFVCVGVVMRNNNRTIVRTSAAAQ